MLAKNRITMLYKVKNKLNNLDFMGGEEYFRWRCCSNSSSSCKKEFKHPTKVMNNRKKINKINNEERAVLVFNLEYEFIQLAIQKSTVFSV